MGFLTMFLNILSFLDEDLVTVQFKSPKNYADKTEK
jgi:hypothetical protein